MSLADGTRVLEAEIDFFYMHIDSGKPARFPLVFTERYRPSASGTATYEALPASLGKLGRWPTLNFPSGPVADS